MTRPDSSSGSANVFTNYNGEAPTMRLRPIPDAPQLEVELPDMPWRVAYAGYRDDAGVACYFKDDVLGWVDTLTLEPWPGREGEARQHRFAANFTRAIRSE